MKPSGSSSSGPETKEYLAKPRERRGSVGDMKTNEAAKKRFLQAAQAEDSTKKKSALAKILKARKSQADAMKGKGKTIKENPGMRKPNPFIPSDPKEAQKKFGK